MTNIRILTAGQEFALEHAMDKETVTLLRFLGRDEFGNLVDGILHEQLIDLLIERFYVLNKREACAENQVIIMLLKNIRSTLRKREDKKKRNRYENNSSKNE